MKKKIRLAGKRITEIKKERKKEGKIEEKKRRNQGLLVKKKDLHDLNGKLNLKPTNFKNVYVSICSKIHKIANFLSFFFFVN